MSERGPQHIAEILAELIARRGLARLREQEAYEGAWRDSVGESLGRYSRVGVLRRGVLEVYVANSVLLQELANFRKAELLQSLRSKLGSECIRDIRFLLDEGD